MVHGRLQWTGKRLGFADCSGSGTLLDISSDGEKMALRTCFTLCYDLLIPVLAHRILFDGRVLSLDGSGPQAARNFIQL